MNNHIQNAIAILTAQLEEVERQIQHTDYPAVFIKHRDKLLETIKGLQEMEEK